MADTSGGGGASPLWLDTGNHSWQMIAATLVGLQIMPGLLMLYSGIVQDGWSINSASMVLYAFAETLIVWVLCGYKMSFGKKLIPIVGIPGPTFGYPYLFGQAELPSTVHHYKNGTIEMPAVKEAYGMEDMVLFQFFFAAITVVLLAGSVLGRMSFKAWMLFVPLWVFFAYTVGAFSVWGGGFLWQWGVLDYAGGYVIHLSSGVAGFTAAYWVGPRSDPGRDRESYPPNNVPIMLAGAGLLWLGWSGFNGGATYSANLVSGLAILNTHFCTASSLLTWTALDTYLNGRPSAIGAVHGMMTGLVAITPAAGFVAPWVALTMGVVIGGITWGCMLMVHRLKDPWSKVIVLMDDTLGVFYTHAVAGFFGGLAVGLLAEPKLCTYMNHVVRNSNGAVYGGNGGLQLLKQLAASGFIIIWNVVVTSIILLIVKYGFRVELRMTPAELAAGDNIFVNEQYAYWGDKERYGRIRHPRNRTGNRDVENNINA